MYFIWYSYKAIPESPAQRRYRRLIDCLFSRSEGTCVVYHPAAFVMKFVFLVETKSFITGVTSLPINSLQLLWCPFKSRFSNATSSSARNAVSTSEVVDSCSSLKPTFQVNTVLVMCVHPLHLGRKILEGILCGFWVFHQQNHFRVQMNKSILVVYYRQNSGSTSWSLYDVRGLPLGHKTNVRQQCLGKEDLSIQVVKDINME